MAVQGNTLDRILEGWIRESKREGNDGMGYIISFVASMLSGSLS
jgi:hypothetical protein